MTTRHTSRKGSLSLPRLPLPLLTPSHSLSLFLFFSVVLLPPHFPMSLSSTKELQPGTHLARRHLRILCFPRDLLLLFYSFTLRFPRPFLLSSFFACRRASAREKRKSHSLLELRSKARAGGGGREEGRRRGRVKRARFIYFPEFCRIPPFNRV